MRYKFPGTPVTLLVGAELKNESQAGILGNDDPRIAVEVEFGDLELWAKVLDRARIAAARVAKRQRLISYVFGGAYNLKPHRFGFDVVYFRDRFFGADTPAVGCDRRATSGVRGRRSTVCGLTPVGRGGSGRYAGCCKAT